MNPLLSTDTVLTAITPSTDLSTLWMLAVLPPTVEDSVSIFDIADDAFPSAFHCLHFLLQRSDLLIP